jgi:hypothetical protein
MTSKKAAIAQPSTLKKAHPFSKREILKEMAILKPMGTCTLEAMKVRRPSLLLLHSPTHSGGSIFFLFDQKSLHDKPRRPSSFISARTSRTCCQAACKAFRRATCSSVSGATEDISSCYCSR